MNMTPPKRGFILSVLPKVSAILLLIYFVLRILNMGYAEYATTFDASLPPKDRLTWLNPIRELTSWSERWRFVITKADFALLSASLKEKNWPDWVSCGGGYGSFNEDSTEHDPLLSTRRDYPHGSGTIMYFYRPRTGELNAIYYDH